MAEALRTRQPAALLLGDHALLEKGAGLAGVISNQVNARVFSHTFTARITRGAGRANIERLPYFPEAIIETLRDPMEPGLLVSRASAFSADAAIDRYMEVLAP